VGDTVFVNGRAVVHATSAGQSIAFPDVCLCPPTPPAGPIPTPLPNTVMAADLAGGATSVLTEGNPTGKQSSFFAKSTGNEPSQPTGGGVITHGVMAKAYFQTFSFDVMFEGEPVVRHLDLLTHNHLGQAPGNTPPVPWLSTQTLPGLPPPPLRSSESDGPGLKLTLKTSTGEAVEDPDPVDVSEAGSDPAPMKMGEGKLENKKPKGVVVVTFHELRRAFWSKSVAAADEDLELGVLSSGFPDGTKGTFEIRHVGDAADSEPLESIDFSLSDGKARAPWKYEQPLKGAASARLVFSARVDKKVAYSAPLNIVAYPFTDVRGVKQRLRALGYDAGPPDASEGGPLESALRAFQGDNEPLEKTGKLDEKTRRVLAAAGERGR
jgi:hypothetical protein